MLVGAGTVLDLAQVDGVRDVGGRLVVMPHGDVAVVRRAKEHRLLCTPGVATPTEAFAARTASVLVSFVFGVDALGRSASFELGISGSNGAGIVEL